MELESELEYYLGELQSSNLLNSKRAISELLRCSASKIELLEYIAVHGQNVSLQDCLEDLQKTKEFPVDPQICIPFAYSLLYLIDSDKCPMEDLLSTIYLGEDPFDTYPIFIEKISTAIKNSIQKADESDLSIQETEEKEEVSPSLHEFCIMLDECDIQQENKDEILNLCDKLNETIKGDDKALCISIYYKIISEINNTKNDKIPKNLLDKFLEENGINL